MKNLIFTLSLVLSIANLVHAQIDKCGHADYMEILDQEIPNYKEQVAATFEKYKAKSQSRLEIQSAQRRSENTVQVVFHVVYNDDAENLPDSVILYQLDQLNKDFNRLNEDSINTRDIFQPIAGSMDIEFVLASTDPEGNPTTGINRVFTEDDNFLDNFFDGNAHDMKFNSLGGTDSWDADRFINVWICDLALGSIPFIAGYATLPFELTNDTINTAEQYKTVDGIVLHYQYVGPNNPTAGVLAGGIGDGGRTLTHEMGHFLGLLHIWGEGDCSVDDGHEDTPPMANATTVTINQSDPIQDCSMELDSIDSCTDDLLPDMWENYMDYIDQKCQNMFTEEQTAFMTEILNGPRSSLLEELPTSISETSNVANDQFFYPNPATNIIALKTEFQQNSGVQVFDMKGNLLLTSRENAIDLSIISAGAYILKLKTDDQVFVNRLIKL